jgi:serine/threonine-protein kinase
MSFAAGTTLGSYVIGTPLGAGGMGEVYRARDTKLKREVAIKVLPDTVAHDADRLARFQREAELLATLNHPNIAAIYGLEEGPPTGVGAGFSRPVHALILELVEGPTLADRIAQGPIPLDDALPIARQTALALEAAHQAGIVHRDLKPSNIKVRPDGTVKVLDFGLAKAREPHAPAELSQSPTITSLAVTGMGVILGTAPYMAPEQAKGHPADTQSDLWAFGCVLYEMLGGRRAFEGEDVTDTIAAVLRGAPDWSALPADVPSVIHTLVRRCLEKDRRQRIANVSIVRFLIEELPGMPVDLPRPTVTPRPVWRRAMPTLLTAIVAGVLAGGAVWIVTPSAPLPISRSRFILPAGQELTNVSRQAIAISPDGARMVYVANERLFLRSLSELEARPIAGTENIMNLPSVGTFNPGSTMNPVFSPDGGSIAYYAGGFKKIAISGGTPVSIARGDPPWGMSWDEDEIVFGQGTKGIMRVSEHGGSPELLVKVGSNEMAANPQMLPGGRAVLYTLAAATDERWEQASIVVQPLPTGDRKIVINGGTHARYVPTGHIVYAVAGTLFAAPFDAQRLEVTGGAAPIVEGVQRSTFARAGTGSAHYSFSSTGALLFIPGSVSTVVADRALVLMDRTGGRESLKFEPNAYGSLRISPDGLQLAVDIDAGADAAVWIYDLTGARAPRRLTFGGDNRFPIWSSDGQRIAFQSEREGDNGIFWQRADGSGTVERLTKPDQGASHVPESWSPQGENLLFSVMADSGAVSLWTMSAKDRKALPFGDARSTSPFNAVFSPDGRWVAYTLRTDTSANVYVEPFPANGAKYQITTDNGHHPIWLPEGKGLTYRVSTSQQVSISVSTQPSFTFGNPTPATTGQLPTVVSVGPRSYDLARDGSRFLVVAPAASGPPAAPEVRIVLNWFEELKRLVPRP